jgi:hypothetical protein
MGDVSPAEFDALLRQLPVGLVRVRCVDGEDCAQLPRVSLCQQAALVNRCACPDASCKPSAQAPVYFAATFLDSSGQESVSQGQHD